MPSVDKCCKLDLLGSSLIHHSIQSCSAGSSCIDNIVNKDNDPAIQAMGSGMYDSMYAFENACAQLNPVLGKIPLIAKVETDDPTALPALRHLQQSSNDAVQRIAREGELGLLTGDEYVVLIDDAMVPTAPALIEKATELAGRPVDFVINTHVHGDHVGGNEYVAKDGAIIVAHDNIRKRMAGDPELDTGPGALPVLTFSDSVTFHVNDREAFVFHIEAAHTDGDAAVKCRHISFSL